MRQRLDRQLAGTGFRQDTVCGEQTGVEAIDPSDARPVDIAKIVAEREPLQVIYYD